MDINKILSAIDHTLLSPSATEAEILSLCDDALAFGVASVCIPTCYVKLCADYLKGRVMVCTVVGFPNGNSTVESKCFEAREALALGADEIDMVINIGALKGGNYDYIKNELLSLRNACGGKILKVIIEACLLTEAEKIKMCELVTDCKADFIKTSTGFSSGGTTLDDIKLFTEHIGNDVKIKAAGGISSLEDAEAFLNAGASRLGTSRIVKILKNK